MKHLRNILNFFKRFFGLDQKEKPVPTPTPTPTPNPIGVYVDNAEVKRILKERLGAKLSRTSKIYLPDTLYYLPPKSDAENILRVSVLDSKKWTSEVFDCDDFSYVLKAEFCQDAYRQGKRRAPYCMGIVWGLLPTPHAINWVITDDKQLYFIEPQTDAVFLPRATDKEIWLLLA